MDDGGSLYCFDCFFTLSVTLTIRNLKEKHSDSGSASFVSEDGSDAENFRKILQESINSIDLSSMSYTKENVPNVKVYSRDFTMSPYLVRQRTINKLGTCMQAERKMKSIKSNAPCGSKQRASLEVTVSALKEEEKVKLKDHAYTLPDEYGGGVICRDNWLWLYGISSRQAKAFSSKLKD